MLSAPISRDLVGSLFVAVALFAAQPAEACSCSATTLADVVAHVDLIAYVEVGAARAEANGAVSSSITIIDVLRGPRGEQRVGWIKPDGVSCNMTNLKPGKWLLFVSWGPSGMPWVGRCDMHSRPLKPDAWKALRPSIVAQLGAVTTQAGAVEAAGRAVRRMLAASLRADANAPPPQADLDLARTDRATVVPQPNGSFVVTWSQHPPAGTSVDAEVRVAKDGVTEVMRATASYSSD